MDHISSKISERESNGMRLFASRTNARDVVTIQGSVLGGANMLPQTKKSLAYFASELLDAGTAKKSKDVLRELLASRGISISFSAGGDRTFFSASCLPEDVTIVLTILAECLSSSVFESSEVSLAKERALADLKEEKTDTTAQGSQALTRLIYDPAHTNYVDTTATKIKNVSTLTAKEVRKFGTSFGRKGLVIALVGDLDPAAALSLAEKAFSKLPLGTYEIAPKKSNSKKSAASESRIAIKDKTNVDVFLGQSVSLTRDDTNYQAFVTLVAMLGGPGFTSHLMSTIRERDGLTYGVRASAAGFSDGADGYLQILALFSPDKYEHSVNALRKEVGVFFTHGITTEKLDMRKVETISAFVIGLSTTRGLAATLHRIGVERKQLDYLDQYRKRISSLSLDDLHAAAALISLDTLSLAAAGTFPAI